MSRASGIEWRKGPTSSVREGDRDLGAWKMIRERGRRKASPLQGQRKGGLVARGVTARDNIEDSLAPFFHPFKRAVSLGRGKNRVKLETTQSLLS